MHSDESNIAISVRNLGKTYRMFDHPGDRIKQFFSAGFKQYYREFPALCEVSFDIKRGEAVGIIGRNGSGKSTLLQLICGILRPTFGSIQVKGRVSALLELGAGFNPEFTGRENVYFQGAMTGIGKEQMDDRFHEIATFAEIGDFIDQPVRTYSSGMFVRLAFAVATNTSPDILIIDEALSVGDLTFQHKSKRRMRQFTEQGGTLVVVSHDQSTVTALCDSGVLIDAGRVLQMGKAQKVFDYYHALVSKKDTESIVVTELDSKDASIISGSGEATVSSIALIDYQRNKCRTIEVGDQVILEFIVDIINSLPKLVFGFTIRNSSGQTIYGTNTISYGEEIYLPKKGQRYRFAFSFLANFGVDSYSISTTLASTGDRFTNNYECRELSYFFEVRNSHLPFFGGSTSLNPELLISLYQDAFA